LFAFRDSRNSPISAALQEYFRSEEKYRIDVSLAIEKALLGPNGYPAIFSGDAFWKEFSNITMSIRMSFLVQPNQAGTELRYFGTGCECKRFCSRFLMTCRQMTVFSATMIVVS
jgi:hypothetical protein